MSYPAYSRAERVADGSIHVLGVGAAVTGVAVLLWSLSAHLGAPQRAGAVIYGAALILMLTASAAYHMGAHTSARPLLRRLDHAFIYVKIAATFTPFVVVIGSTFAYGVLAMVWILSLLGAGHKLRAARGRMTTASWPYVVLGWMGLLLVWPMIDVSPWPSIVLMTVGGLLYCAGLPFYAAERLRFANAIWHGFVLVASACFFAAVATTLQAQV
jgi:hemolysin III